MSKNILLDVDAASHDPARHVLAAADMTRDLSRSRRRRWRRRPAQTRPNTLAYRVWRVALRNSASPVPSLDG